LVLLFLLWKSIKLILKIVGLLVIALLAVAAWMIFQHQQTGQWPLNF
jgi:hypothetical protein